jgi:hypothetical protein
LSYSVVGLVPPPVQERFAHLLNKITTLGIGVFPGVECGSDKLTGDPNQVFLCCLLCAGHTTDNLIPERPLKRLTPYGAGTFGYCCCGQAEVSDRGHLTFVQAKAHHRVIGVNLVEPGA